MFLNLNIDVVSLSLITNVCAKSRCFLYDVTAKLQSTRTEHTLH